MTEEELQREAMRAGTFYVQDQYKDAPQTERWLAANACAHGFGMAIRWYEKSIRMDAVNSPVETAVKGVSV
jgi:hypothetical protein